MKSEPQTTQNPSRQVTLETVKKMSDEELRILIAELRGWKRVQFEGATSSFYEHPDRPSEYGFKRLDNPGPILPSNRGLSDHDQLSSFGIPDYPNDLNAVHEIEKKLDLQQQHDYASQMAQRLRDEEDIALGEKSGRNWPLNGFGYFALLNATARKRCEALVLCLSPERKL